MSFDNKIGEGKYVISVDSSGAITQLQQFESKSVQSTKRVESSFKSLTASTIGLATSSFSLYQGLDRLEKTQLRAEKAALVVARAQKQLNDLQAEGKQNTEQYTLVQEKLRLSQEQLKQAQEDITENTVQFGLSLVSTGATMITSIAAIRSMAVAHTATAGAATAHTVANVGLTASFRALTVAMMSNPLGLALVAGSIAALAVYSTNLGGVKDKVDNLIGSFAGGKDPVMEFHGELEQGTKTTNNYIDSIHELDSAYDSTISKLKKNDLSNSLVEAQAQMAETMIFMGSLEQMFNELKASGVEGFVREIAPDLRRVPTAKKRDADFIKAWAATRFNRRANLKRNISFGGIPESLRDTISLASSEVNTMIRLLRGGGDTYSGVLAGALANLTGVPQSLAGSLINGGKTGSTRSVSGSVKARRGGFGGTKRGWGTQEVIRPFSESISKLQPTIDEFAALGFNIQAPRFNLDELVRGIKSPSNEFLQASIGQATAQYQLELARYNQQIADARRTIEERVLGLASRSGLSRSQVVALQSTQQGTDDLYGIIDYRERLARASTGTG